LKEAEINQMINDLRYTQIFKKAKALKAIPSMHQIFIENKLIKLFKISK
jgi:hypothetical protein